jgi:periplasmic protein TonB
MDEMELIEQALFIAFRRESPSAGFADRVEYRLSLQTVGAGVWAPGSFQAPVRERRDKASLRATVLGVWHRLFLNTESASAESNAEALPFRGLPQARRSPASIAFSMALHTGVFALIAFILLQGRLHVRNMPATQSAAVDLKPWLPVMPRDKSMGGGGGGGDRDPVQVSKGALPRFDKQQLSPPQIVRNDHPKLAVEPTIVMLKNIPLPDAAMPNLGLPTSSQVQLASNGTGSGAGMGSGHNGGIGSGNGGGYGPGSGGGTGGGVYHVGGGVSSPSVVYSVDPEYSDEARRAKFTGIVMVSLIVDAQGLPEHVHVARSLGMGLDERAIEAVRQYKFKPATYQGKPVPVAVQIEVNFQIY